MIHRVYETLKEVFEETRGICCEGNDRLLERVHNLVGIEYIDIESGSTVDRWKIPEGWELVSASFRYGKRELRSEEYPLLVPYGTASFTACGTKDIISSYIYTSEKMTEAFPYRTNYYSPDNSRICIPDKLWAEIPDGTECLIEVKSRFFSHHMRLGELVLRGKSSQEILITSYNCHPGLGNDNFSGIVSLVYLIERLKKLRDRHFTYRFALFPETIGAVFYIDYLKRKNIFNRINGGVVLTCLGGHEKTLVLKRSRYQAPFTRLTEEILSDLCPGLRVEEFYPDGSDERQFGAAGVRLPCISISKSKYYDFKEYHTSADTLDYMSIDAVEKSVDCIFQALIRLDIELRVPRLIDLCGEPHLSSYNICFHDGGSYERTSPATEDFIDGCLADKRLLINYLSYANGEYSDKELYNRLARAIPAYQWSDHKDFTQQLARIGIISY